MATRIVLLCIALLCLAGLVSPARYTFGIPGRITHADAEEIINAVIRLIRDYFLLNAVYSYGSSVVGAAAVQGGSAVITLWILDSGGRLPWMCSANRNPDNHVEGNTVRRSLMNLVNTFGSIMYQESPGFLSVFANTYRIDYTFEPSEPDVEAVTLSGRSFGAPVQQQQQQQLQPLDEDCEIASTTLRSGDTLLRNQVLTSPNGLFRLWMQKDCNLVLYGQSNTPVWSSKTDGQGHDCFLKMQWDGNLVVYNSFKVPVWSINEFCRCLKPSYFTVQDDRNMVVYAIATLASRETPTWASKSRL